MSYDHETPCTVPGNRQYNLLVSVSCAACSAAHFSCIGFLPPNASQPCRPGKTLFCPIINMGPKGKEKYFQAQRSCFWRWNINSIICKKGRRDASESNSYPVPELLYSEESSSDGEGFQHPGAQAPSSCADLALWGLSSENPAPICLRSLQFLLWIPGTVQARSGRRVLGDSTCPAQSLFLKPGGLSSPGDSCRFCRVC